MNKLQRIIMCCFLSLSSCTVGVIDKNKIEIKENELKIKIHYEIKTIPLLRKYWFKDQPPYRKQQDFNPVSPERNDVYLV